MTGLYEGDDKIEDGLDQTLFTELLEYAEENFSIDDARKFILGLSNGGFQALRLACDMPEKFAGIVQYLGTMDSTWPSSCTPSTPINILFANYDSGPMIFFPPDEDTISVGSQNDTAFSFYIQYTTATVGFPDIRIPPPPTLDNLLIYTTLATKSGANAWATLNGCTSGQVDFDTVVATLDNTINANDGLFYNRTPAAPFIEFPPTALTPGDDVQVFQATGCPIDGSVSYWLNAFPTNFPDALPDAPVNASAFSALNWTEHTTNLLAWFDDNYKKCPICSSSSYSYSYDGLSDSLSATSYSYSYSYDDLCVC